MNEVHPVIISASRRTDVPAFYMEDFLRDWRKGYTIWTNPFNPKQKRVVRFDRTKLVVFWTKFPAGYMKLFKEIDFPHLILFTLNHYPELELNLPDLEKRVEVFIEVSKMIGRDKVVWRFDPIVLVEGKIEKEDVVQRFEKILKRVEGYTRRVIISFMTPYRKSILRMEKYGVPYREPKLHEVEFIAENLGKMAKDAGLEIQTCSDRFNALGELERFGIRKGACIDKDYILDVFKNEKDVVEYVKKLGKDRGQRKLCMCAESVDIGEYRTCKFKCLYCYAI